MVSRQPVRISSWPLFTVGQAATFGIADHLQTEVLELGSRLPAAPGSGFRSPRGGLFRVGESGFERSLTN
jgi:hypothetical protein